MHSRVRNTLRDDHVLMLRVPTDLLRPGDFQPPPDHRARYKGVWYRGPLVHNGRIATLEDRFDPKRIRADCVPRGYRAYGVTQRAVPGHPCGLSLHEKDRRALIAFPRTALITLLPAGIVL
jgi:hypothetical protein